jgi:hypothetical protein
MAYDTSTTIALGNRQMIRLIGATVAHTKEITTEGMNVVVHEIDLLASGVWTPTTGGIEYTGGGIYVRGTPVTVAAPTNFIHSIAYNNLDGYGNDTTYPMNWRVYSYKDVGTHRIYSSGYATLVSDSVNNPSNGFAFFTHSISWDAEPAADGYRVIKYDPDFMGFVWDGGLDTTATSLSDDRSFDFDPAIYVVTPDAWYSNTNELNGDTTAVGSFSLLGDLITEGTITHTGDASISGTLSANYINGAVVKLFGTNDFVFGSNTTSASWVGGGGSTIAIGPYAGYASGASNTIYVGTNAGRSAYASTFSIFFGSDAGNGAVSANNSIFFGTTAGYNATAANNSIFFGNNAGNTATNANSANFFGYLAGFSATNAHNSNFFGNQAGYQATNAENSFFAGRQAGQSAANAKYSIFIGAVSGTSDTVNNGTNDFSILIGRNTNTDGNKNSIAIGGWIKNTAANQLNIGNAVWVTNIYSGSTQSTAARASNLGIGTNNPQAPGHFVQQTLGNEVFRIESIATNDDPRESVYQNRLATTNATQTTMHTFTVPASTTYAIEAIVIARRTGGSAGTAEDGARYKLSGVYKNVGGTATLIGALGVTADEDQAAWDATLNLTGATVLLQVTGATNNNITWHMTARVYPVSS